MWRNILVTLSHKGEIFNYQLLDEDSGEWTEITKSESMDTFIFSRKINQNGEFPLISTNQRKNVLDETITAILYVNDADALCLELTRNKPAPGAVLMRDIWCRHDVQNSLTEGWQMVPGVSDALKVSETENLIDPRKYKLIGVLPNNLLESCFNSF